MGDKVPGTDEEIIRRFERIIIRGVRHEVILTTTRLILKETETGQTRREAPYPEIVLANLGINTLREPEISLSFSTAQGDIETEELVFTHLPGGQNVMAADRCMDILREHQVVIRRTASPEEMGPPTRAESVMGEGRVSSRRGSAPDFSRYGFPPSQQSATDEGGRGIVSPPVLAAFAIAALLVIVIILGAISGFMGGGTPGPQGNITPAPVVTLTPVLLVPPEPVTAAPTPSPAIPEVSLPDPIPQNGTWVVVSSVRNYTGNIKAGGWNVAVNSSGTSSYLLPVREGRIEGSIRKSEGTGETMTVGVYYFGKCIEERSTYKPFGAIDLSLDIQEALRATPTATPTPRPSLAVPADVTIPALVPPSNGVWARVYYPGEYSGYISANGRARDINGSGDQLFQLYTSSGSIQGTIEKLDYSGRNLAVQLYKDGVLITTVNTTAPHGDVDLTAEL